MIGARTTEFRGVWAVLISGDGLLVLRSDYCDDTTVSLEAGESETDDAHGPGDEAHGPGDEARAPGDDARGTTVALKR